MVERKAKGKELYCTKIEEEEERDLTEDDEAALNTLRQMREVFSDEQLSKVVDLLNAIIDKPEVLEPTIDFTSEWKREINKPFAEKEIPPSPKVSNEKMEPPLEEQKEIPENM